MQRGVGGRKWSGDARALDKLSVSGRPTNLDNSRARDYCACSTFGGGCLGIFSSAVFEENVEVLS